MNTQKFTPEGWTNFTPKISKYTVKEYIQTKETIQGIVEKCDDSYNLHINLGKGITGIMPREEIDAIDREEKGLPRTSLCKQKVNKYIQFKVKQIDENNTPILSRKEVQEEAIQWIKNDLEIGQNIKGIVKNIRPYGAFIEIGGGVVGLAHIEDLSVARIKTPFERLKIGQKLDVVVKSVDRRDGKVILSYKETLGTWEDNIKNFKQGSKVKGVVREIEKNKNGIFIELSPNLVGMAEYQEGLEYGKQVEIFIKKIDTQKKKVKLVII